MKTNKLILLFSMLLSMLATSASAYDIAVKNAEGVMIYYNYTNNNTEVEVTYKDMMSGDCYSGSIVIPKEVTYNKKTLKVTSIGNYAFDQCTGLTSITIGNNVTSIGNWAFRGCENVTSLKIGTSVTSIGVGAFSGFSKMTSLTIPNSVTSIGNVAFLGWKSLTTLTIPNSVKTIGESAFYNCSSLTSLTIGNGVTSIDIWAFDGCNNLQKVISKIVYPFDVVTSPAAAIFSEETYSKAILYVPKGTAVMYNGTWGWMYFDKIVEEGTTTGINDVEVDNTLDTSKGIYDINGNRLPATSLDELPSGLYIINGKKVMKK